MLLALFHLLNACPDEITEQRMRTRWAALELRMELRCNKPGMIPQFDDLDQAIVSRATTDDQTMRLHALAIFVIELITMAMALKDYRLTICLISPGPLRETTNP